MRYLAASALLYAGIIGVAVAQTTPGSTPPATTGTGTTTGTGAATGTGTTPGAIQSAQTTAVVTRFVTMKPADTLSSRLIGTNLYNLQNESLGEIEDLVIENGRTVTGIVVGVGGFLGMGERYVAIDPSSITLRMENNAIARATVDTSKDSLSKAPAFDYSRRR